MHDIDSVLEPSTFVRLCRKRLDNCSPDVLDVNLKVMKLYATLGKALDAIGDALDANLKTMRLTGNLVMEFNNITALVDYLGMHRDTLGETARLDLGHIGDDDAILELVAEYECEPDAVVN